MDWYHCRYTGPSTRCLPLDHSPDCHVTLCTDCRWADSVQCFPLHRIVLLPTLDICNCRLTLPLAQVFAHPMAYWSGVSPKYSLPLVRPLVTATAQARSAAPNLPERYGPEYIYKCCRCTSPARRRRKQCWAPR